MLWMAADGSVGMAGERELRIIHDVAEVIGNQLGVVVTIAGTLSWLGTRGLPARAFRALGSLEMLIGDAVRVAAGAELARRLVRQNLVRQVRANDDAPTWREDEQGGVVDLGSLDLRRAATPADMQAISPQAQPNSTASTAQDAGSEAKASSAGNTQQPVAAVPGTIASMRALFSGLIRRNEGAMINDLIARTNGLPAHHARRFKRLAHELPRNRQQQDTAANGVHLRDRRDHDESGGLPVMASIRDGAPIGEQALHAAEPFDDLPMNEELARFSSSGPNPRAYAGVPSLIVRCPPCTEASDCVAFRLTISIYLDLIRCSPATFPARSNAS